MSDDEPELKTVSDMFVALDELQHFSLEGYCNGDKDGLRQFFATEEACYLASAETGDDICAKVEYAIRSLEFAESYHKLKGNEQMAAMARAMIYPLRSILRDLHGVTITKSEPGKP
jgi:hypothetical protein